MLTNDHSILPNICKVSIGEREDQIRVRSLYLYLRWQAEAGLNTTSRRVRLLSQAWTLGKRQGVGLGSRRYPVIRRNSCATPSPGLHSFGAVCMHHSIARRIAEKWRLRRMDSAAAMQAGSGSQLLRKKFSSANTLSLVDYGCTIRRIFLGNRSMEFVVKLLRRKAATLSRS